MRDIESMDFEVWYKATGSCGRARQLCAFHYRHDAEEYIERQHKSIRDNYFLKVLGEPEFFPNETF